MSVTLRGRRSIWCSWRVTLVAPCIVNDVSYLTRITHEIHFAWQAQYLAGAAFRSILGDIPEREML